MGGRGSSELVSGLSCQHGMILGRLAKKFIHSTPKGDAAIENYLPLCRGEIGKTNEINHN